jgi:RHS repeat-associated protein
MNNVVTFTHDQDGNQTYQDNMVSATNPVGTSELQLTYDAADQNTQAIFNSEYISGDALPGANSSSSAVSKVRSAMQAGQSQTAPPAGCPWPEVTLTDNFSVSGAPRNPDGQLTQASQSIADDCGTSTPLDQFNYSYDPAGQLSFQGTTAQGIAPNNFAYDHAGDPIELAGTTQTFDAAGEVTSWPHTYDTIGDRTDSGVNGYNQLGQMSSSGSGTTYYKNNGDGLQVSEGPSTTTVTNQLLWDTTGSLPRLLSDGTNDYIYGPGSTPVEQFAPAQGLGSSNPLFINFSPSDSFYTMTDTDGNYQIIQGYNAYGTPNGLWSGYSQPSNTFGFAGQYFDPSGFYDMRARYYDAGTGVFTTVDPALSTTGEPYQYAGDDPVNRTDPSGDSGQWPIPQGSVVSQLLSIWGVSTSQANSKEFTNVNSGSVYYPAYLVGESFGGSTCVSFLGVVDLSGNCNPSPDNTTTLESATLTIWEITWAGLYSGESTYAPNARGTSLNNTACSDGFNCWLDNVLDPSLVGGSAPDETTYWWRFEAQSLGYSTGAQKGLLDDIDNGQVAADILGELAVSLAAYDIPEPTSTSATCT